MDVKVFAHTTIWDTKDGADPVAIPERRTDALRIILDPAIKAGELRALVAAANAYSRVRVVIVKGSRIAWSHLRHFKSLHGMQAHGIDKKTTTRLDEIPASIAELVLGVVEQPNKVVDVLQRFTALKSLTISGKLDGIGGIVTLRSLRDLHLYYASKIDMRSLRELVGLRRLTIHHGSIAQLPNADTLPKLEMLDIWKTQGIESMQWISGITGLRDLRLGALPRVAAIPDLAHHSGLERVALDQMKGFTSVADFARAPCLRTIHIKGMNQIQLEDYEAFIGHHTLSEISSGFSSKKKNDQVNKLLGIPRVSYEPAQDTREF